VGQKHHMFETRCDKIIFSKIPKCDQVNMRNIYECNEFAEDIHTYMKEVEATTIPKANYMKGQTDINESMRAILVDWMVDVHLKFKLLSETLFLTVNLIDRYLSAK
jgi:cyclin B